MSEIRNAHWENHSKVLIGGLQKQLEQSELCDCTIVAEGQSLKAHKVILSACSPYFKSLFLQSHDKDVFVLHRDIKFRELKSLIEFVYYGDLLFSDDTIEELILAAEILQIRGLQGRSKACFQSTKQVVEEEKCPTEFKKVRFDCEKDQKPPLPLITAFGGFVLKEEKESDEYECEPQGTDTIHVDTRDATHDSGRGPMIITTQQEVTAQISVVREEPTSTPENHNTTVRGNKRKISQETCAQPHFSEFSVILQDVWKEGSFQRDNEGHLIISGIRCDFLPLVSTSREMQSEAHDKAACTSKVNVNGSKLDQIFDISKTPCVNQAQESNFSDQTHSHCNESNELPSHMTNHVRTRGLENKHTCFECGKNFKCAFNLENHLWTHSVDRPFVCNICGKAFSIKGNYKHHVYLHSNERPYVCQGCGRSFKVVSSLQSHYRQHCGRQS